MFVLIDLGLRTYHSTLNRYTFIKTLSVCSITVNPVTAVTLNVAICVYATIMGLFFLYTLWNMSRGSSDKTLLAVGFRSTVFTLLLIIVKGLFYIPFALGVLGPFAGGVFLIPQSALQSVLLTMTTIWTKNTIKEYSVSQSQQQGSNVFLESKNSRSKL